MSVECNLYKLFRIHCDDLLVLEEMEWNGMLFDRAGALKEADELSSKLDDLLFKFRELCNNTFVDINSGKHVSAVLYGGTIEEVVKVATGIYKSGAKKGQIKYKNEKIEHVFERLVSPLKDTETKRSIKKKEETSESTEWSVSEDIIKKLKARGKAKELIKIILEYRELYKLKSTYLEGWSNLIKSQHWKEDMIHSNLNQCTAVTGRLSSSSPNAQNADKKTKRHLISRYDNSQR